MVSKKTNKISPKDINLLLNKLIIIIKKFSNSCGNKKKRVCGGVKWFSMSDKPKKLNDEIDKFILNNFKSSLSFLKNINNEYFLKLGINKIFAKKNIDLLDKDNNFHNPDNFQYNNKEKSIINYIKSDKNKIESKFESFIRDIDIDIKLPLCIEYYKEENDYILYFKDKDESQLLHPDTGDIGYISFKYNNPDIPDIPDRKNVVSKSALRRALNKVLPYYKYYMLNKQIYDSISSNTDFDILSLDNISKIKEYIKEIEDKIKPIINSPNYDYKKLDTLITFYYYSKYITEINVDDDKNIIDINKLIKSQEKCGIYDEDILKHAVIYNIGIMLKSIKSILKSSDA